MRKKATFAVAALAGALCATNVTFAGTDVTGVVAQMWVDSSGNLWFRLNNTSADAYCAKNWGNNNLYVPATNANYAFFYGIVLASLTKGLTVDVPNISVFNGSTSCDITQTGYGIMLE
jgi:hypothetical protein